MKGMALFSSGRIREDPGRVVVARDLDVSLTLRRD